ncbi:inactive ubiquitin carboxyl-terminal hydrolase MINDY-4B isoform X2 [Microcaecilia unicolor]|uniref:Ubiquitin carboxyl-terminal hydrolase MINDY n=1 Tax=Microcaecilia unicolor TaxID=1415580 RepID=A0A6P7Z7T1_9AMPH|nr:inactive ubiquitin carboxyl-terminal hydrolase MINDY-4B isoform X2 [Microcaecilia unicolor]
MNSLDNFTYANIKKAAQSSALRLESSKAAKQKDQANQKSDDVCEGERRAPQSTGSKKHAIPGTLTVPASLGGQPISIEMALHLRMILCGSTFQVFNYEWRKAYFKFHDPYSDLSYALEAEKGGARGVQMSVQAYIIKYLLLIRNSDENWSMASLHGINQKEQERSLSVALTDILWTAGEGQKVTVCLITPECYFTATSEYKADNFTERLLLFEIYGKEAVQTFIHDHIHCFKSEGSHGVILFLYSLIFTRTFEKLRKDLDFTTSHLLQCSLGNFICKQALINMMLTGRSSPNVFNGDQKFDSETEALKSRHGVLTRSDVGYLHWNREKMEHGSLPQVGSMLKTPKLPIWLCNINGTYSVLFSTNRLLLSDWKVEHLFDLYYYNGQKSQNKTIHLTIDTHSHYWEGRHHGDETDIEKRFPSLEMTIRTKWRGAAINWNGTVPFF